MNFNLHDHTILLTVSGSRAYGIHTPQSDVDVKGVCVPSKEYFFGVRKRFEQVDRKSHFDVFAQYLNEEQRVASTREKLEGVIYSLQKFIRLAADANPNILDVLFCRNQEILFQTPLGEKLRENRGLFISAKVKHTFSGYALAQLKRIKGHRKWLLEPPKGPPKRSDFDLDEQLLSKHERNCLQDAIRKQLDLWEWDFGDMQHSDVLYVKNNISEILADMGIHSDNKWIPAARSLGAAEDLIAHIGKERKFIGAKRNWQQYQTWRKQRNPIRAEMERKHGYDLKHAAHLVRLLRMGLEILTTGKINVWRGDIDAEELIAIRNGQWSYEELLEWAGRAGQKLDEVYQAQQYDIPREPQREKIEGLCIDLITCFLGQ